MYAKIKNGEIVKTGNLFDMNTRCSNPTLLSQDEIKALNVYLVEFTPLTTNSWEYKGEASYTYDSTLDKVIGTYEVLEIPLEEFKQTKLLEIKQTHEQILTEGFISTTGIKIDCEDKNLNDFSNALSLLNLSDANGLAIVDFVNNTINLSKVEYESLLLELGQYVTKLLFDKQILRGLVNNCLSHIEVNDIYWRKLNYKENSEEVIGFTYNPIL